MKPITPLPWKTGRLEEGSSPSKEVRTEDRERDYNGSLVTKANKKGDAAYIAHACNAYPRLKEVLLGVLVENKIAEGSIPHDVLTMLREGE